MRWCGIQLLVVLLLPAASLSMRQALCRELGVNATRVSIDAGHCPQDENPAQVNAALAEFLAGVSFGGPRAE